MPEELQVALIYCIKVKIIIKFLIDKSNLKALQKVIYHTLSFQIFRKKKFNLFLSIQNRPKKKEINRFLPYRFIALIIPADLLDDC